MKLMLLLVSILDVNLAFAIQPADPLFKLGKGTQIEFLQELRIPQGENNVLLCELPGVDCGSGETGFTLGCELAVYPVTSSKKDILIKKNRVLEVKSTDYNQGGSNFFDSDKAKIATLTLSNSSAHITLICEDFMINQNITLEKFENAFKTYFKITLALIDSETTDVIEI